MQCQQKYLQSYGYNAMGYLTGVSISIGGEQARTRATYSRDLLGRVNDYTEYDNAGTIVHARNDIEYTKRDQVLLEKTRTKQGSDWLYTHMVNYYSETGHGVAAPEITDSAQAGTSSGAVLYVSRNKNWKNGNTVPVYPSGGGSSQADLDYADAYTTNSYDWTDGAQQSSVQYVNRDGTTSASYSYDSNGSLESVAQTGGTRPRQIAFASDAQGRVLTRSETDNNSSQSDPRQRYYRFGGIDMGLIGNDGSDNSDYATSIAQRTAAPPNTPGAFQGGATSGTPYADFDQAYDAINGSGGDQGGGTASHYTVRQGDTLQSIARDVWGDASLWYMLADANGFARNGELAPGTGLIIPDKGTNFHNNADTFRPYNPAAAIGDTQPGVPKPPKKSNKCGVLGQILVTIVTVAVTIVASAYLGPVAGAAVLAQIGAAITPYSLAGAGAKHDSEIIALVSSYKNGFGTGYALGSVLSIPVINTSNVGNPPGAFATNT